MKLKDHKATIMLLVPALRVSEFKANLVYRVSARTVGLHRETLTQKATTKTKSKNQN